MMKVIVLTAFRAFLFFNHKWHLRSGWGGRGAKKKLWLANSGCCVQIASTC